MTVNGHSVNFGGGSLTVCAYSPTTSESASFAPHGSPWRCLQLVPPFAGKAEIKVRLVGQIQEEIAAYPDSFRVLPLSLDDHTYLNMPIPVKVKSKQTGKKDMELFSL